jgi:DNA-binding NarL/FixJ family response regulator
MADGTIRILLADDHALVRGGIGQLLSMEPDMEVVGEAADGLEAHARALALRPDLILMDLNMPRVGGLEAIARIKADLPEVRIVALTYSDDEQDIAEALRRGAEGYLLKTLEPDTLAMRVRDAMRGEAPMSGAVAKKLLRDLMRPEPAEPESQAPPAEEPAPRGQLTAREVQILALVAAGATNREIGVQLFLAENTVKNHIKNILAKLQVENRTQAVAWAMREGLLDG